MEDVVNKKNINEVFEMTRKSAVAINYENQRFAIMTGDEFVNMKEELANLQKTLFSIMDDYPTE